MLDEKDPSPAGMDPVPASSVDDATESSASKDKSVPSKDEPSGSVEDAKKAETKKEQQATDVDGLVDAHVDKEESKPKDESVVKIQPLPDEDIPEAKKMPAEESKEVKAEPAEQKPVEQKKGTDSTEKDKPIAKDKPAEKKKTVAAVATKTDINTNYYILTVLDKNVTHPSYGKGHKLGFALNDVQGRTIAMRRGNRYEFDVRTNPLHDVYFSTSPVGWGGGVVINGISGQFTYKGVIEINPDKETPDVIYYQCRNHSTMGGKVFVVDKGTPDAKIKKLIASVKVSSGKLIKTKKAKVSIAKLRQKMTFADMMLMSKGTKRVDASSNKEAKELLNTARQKMDEARKLLVAGNNEKALGLADSALRLIGSSSRLVPSEEVLEERKVRYTELLDAVKNFEQSHKISMKFTIKSRGKKAAVEYDKKEVASILSEAKTLADKRKFVPAVVLLEKAERIVTSALNVMLDSQTIVYDLKFETAEDEYKYELKRFTGYEDLIPIAIARKRPRPGAVKLMDGFVAKGRSQRADAIEKAKQGDFPTAIAMMLSATTQVRRALRIAGVSQ